MEGIETYVLIQLGRDHNFASPVVFIMSEKNVIKKLGYLRHFTGDIAQYLIIQQAVL